MLNILTYTIKLGIAIGAIILNIGVMVWVFTEAENNKVWKEIISAALFLIVLSLLLYLW